MTEDEALAELIRHDAAFNDPPTVAAFKAWVQIIARRVAADAVAEALDVPHDQPVHGFRTSSVKRDICGADPDYIAGRIGGQ